MTDVRLILIPFCRHEATTLQIAAHIAGVSESTMRTWCQRDGIGRKIGGIWNVSRPALTMSLEGDFAALAAYHSGERRGHPVASYFERAGLAEVLASPVFNSVPTKSTKSAELRLAV